MGYFYTQKEGEILANLQQIIDFLNRKYPDHGETTANIILDIDDIHKDIYMRLRRLSNAYDIYEMETVANQLYYDISDTEFNVYNIEELKVSMDSSGKVFEGYKYRGSQDTRIYGRRWGRGADNTIFIMKDDNAVHISGLKIHIYYFKRPATLSFADKNNVTEAELEQVPDLDEDYHDLLKFGIVQAIASQGHNPDIEIANYYQQKFDEKFAIVSKEIESRNLSSYIRIPQQREVW